MPPSALLQRAGFRHVFCWDEGRAEPGAPLAPMLGIAATRLFVQTQVHGTACRVVGLADSPEEVRRGPGDVLLTAVPGVGCAVRTADCVPVLVADARTGAVAAIHSGWRGTVANVTSAAVAALRRLTGQDGVLLAAIGPHIGACCFEVGEDVAAQLAACSEAAETAVHRAAGRAHVDLRRVVRSPAPGRRRCKRGRGAGLHPVRARTLPLLPS